MLKLITSRADGGNAVTEVGYGIFTIGSDPENRIVLFGEGVQPHHAVLTLMPDESYIEDLCGTGHLTVNGDPVEIRQRVFENDRIFAGTAELSFCTDEAPANPAPLPFFKRADEAPLHPAPEAIESRRTIRRDIHRELLRRLDIKRLTVNRIQQEELQQRIRKTLEEIVREQRERLPSGVQPPALVKEIYDEAVGLGPLEDLLADPGVTEIMVNGPDQVYVEKQGRLQRVAAGFVSNDSVCAVIERIVSPIGRRIDESQPYVDARLPDGSRVNAIIPPLSLTGPCMTIRVFSKIPYTVEDLSGFGTLTPDMAGFLEACVKARKSILVSGGTGSGKTTLLNVLSAFLPEEERIITIEDAAELRLTQTHVVRLESRPPNIEGRGAVTIRDLVRNALRMRPDRIVVGECRGGEALDMLQAMNTGHEGSLTTVHANSPRDALSRLETMVLMAGMDLPIKAIREQVGSAIDLIVHISRCADGTRKVTRISEIVGMEGDRITLQDLFEYQQRGISGEGRVDGEFRPCGAVPSFADEFKARGIPLNLAVFGFNRRTEA